MSTYLVTGGAGFIGSHLADTLLAAGHAVRVLDNLSTGRRENLDPRCQFMHGDAADAADVRAAMAGTDGCFHLAAIASVARANEDWVGTHVANQTATIQVLDAARREGGLPVVYASSAAIYGDQGEGPIREDACPQPLTAYGADKLGSELHAAVGSGVHQVPTCGMRFFNVYGPRQDPSSPYSGVISIFCARLKARAPIVLHGDGRQTRDFIFVGDVVEALITAMRRMKPGAAVYNICTGQGTTIARLARIISDLLTRGPLIGHGPARPGDIRHSVGDPAKAWLELGFRASTPLIVGLGTTLGVELRQDRRETPSGHTVGRHAARSGPAAERGHAADRLVS